MGIRTVAIYSDEDIMAMQWSQSRWVLPDEFQRNDTSWSLFYTHFSISLKWNPKEIKVDVIHTGYGFLSESADFAQACLDNSIRFVGPSPDVVRNMDDKKNNRSNVLIVPGTEEAIPRLWLMLWEIWWREHDFPIILKEVFGGGWSWDESGQEDGGAERR